MRNLLVTIDGPAGAGKTTVSRALADRLGYRYVDTGALYRGVAYAAARRGVAPDDDAGLSGMLEGLRLNFLPGPSGQRLTADGLDISDAIRSPELSMLASGVSARAVVRAFLLRIQRELGRQKAAVFEGRDMGTVVFPDAPLKIFLVANVRARAERRYKQLMEKGFSVKLTDLLEDMQARDARDAGRANAPLVAAADAVTIDSSGLSIDQTVSRVLALWSERQP